MNGKTQANLLDIANKIEKILQVRIQFQNKFNNSDKEDEKCPVCLEFKNVEQAKDKFDQD